MIVTDRLLLRPHHINDFNVYLPLWTRASPSRKDPPSAQPLGEEETWNRLLRLIGHWTTFGYGPFLVVDRASDLIVGEVGFARFHRSNGPAYEGVPEAMWRIDHSHQGKGIAREAMQAAAGWFDAKQISKRTVCMIDVSNTASNRLADCLGFHEFATVIYRSNPVRLLERMHA
jgi:RimJ/RimL family protein N-acetyltransferase